jgi:hypothetical protein
LARIDFTRSISEQIGADVDADDDLASLRGKTPAQLNTALDALLSTAAGQRRVIKLLARIALHLLTKKA